MPLHPIASCLLTACFLLAACLPAPARAEVQTVPSVIDTAVVPELVSAETPGDFLLAFGTRTGVYGVPVVDGEILPSQSLVPWGWGLFSAASPQLSRMPGRGMQLAFAQDNRAAIPSLTLWSSVLDNSLSPSAPVRMQFAGPGSRARPAEIDVLADPSGELCCSLVAWTYPEAPLAQLELRNARGERVASHAFTVDGSADARVRRPSLAYQFDAGFFLVAYETRRDIRVRPVYATRGANGSGSFKWIGADLIVATKTQPARYEDLVDGHPHVAYSAELRQFLVTWLDHTSSTGTARRVMARALTRAGVPSGASFVVQTSCAPSNWTCLLTRPITDGAPQVFAMPGGFQLSFAAMPWNQPDRFWGVLGVRLTPAGSGFNFSARWLPDTLQEARISALRTAYDPRSGIAAAAWLATTRDPAGPLVFEETSLKFADFLP